MECFVALLALGVLVSFILSIWAWSRVKSVESQAQQALNDLPRRFERLERMYRELAWQLARLEAGGVAAAKPAAGPEAPRPEAAFHAEAAPSPPMERPGSEVAPPPPFLSGESREAPPPAPEPMVVPVPSPPEVPASLPIGEPASPPLAAAAPPDVSGPAEEPQAPPAPPPSVLPPREAAVPEPSAGFDWERLVGVKLFSWVAGIALVLAALIFLRWSVEQGWIGPGVRLAMGVLTGLGLLAVCELKVARRYKVTADAMDAAGIAILFASLYAGHALWNLYPAAVAFAALVVVTAVAVLLSLRHDSLFIAFLGLLGGFATPALLASGTDRPITLFGYLLLLNTGLVWVARQRGWPLLSALALGLTVLYQWGWVTRFLTGGKVPLAMGIFLIFPLLHFALSALARERDEESASHRHVATLAAILPLLFVLYLAASPGLGLHHGLFFGFLFLLAAGLAVVAAWRGPGFLHLVAAASTAVAFLAWVTRSYTPAAWPGPLGFVALFVVFYLAAPRLFARLGRPLGEPATWAVYTAPALFFVFPILAGIEPAAASPAVLFGTLFALLAVAGGFALSTGNAWLYLPAALFALLAEVVWSAAHLGPESRGIALLLYLAFGLYTLAVPALAVALERSLVPGAGVFLAPLACLLFLFVATSQELAVPPAPLFLALGVLLVAAVATALSLPRGGLQVASVSGAALVLLAWGAVMDSAPWPRVAVFAYLLLAFFAWGVAQLARRQAGAWSALPARGFAVAAAVANFAGVSGLIQASVGSSSPPLSLVLAGQAALLVLLFVLAEQTGWELLAPFSVPFAVCASIVWIVGERAKEWEGGLAFSVALFLLYAAWPFVLGERARARKGPFLAAVLAGLALFLPALYSFRQGPWADRVGLLPLGFAAVLALVLWRLVRLAPAPRVGEPANRGLVVLVAGAVLAFITVAIPLQLDREWITLGWALLATALAWLWRRLPHPGLLFWTGGLAAAVFARLVLNPAVLTYHLRSGAPVLNWYLYTYLVPALAFLAAAWLLRRGRQEDGRASRLAAGLSVGAVALLFLLLNIEIADFYSTGTTLTFGFLSGRASLAEDLTYTLGWAVFAVALLVVGIAVRNRPSRVAAILLLSVAVLKGFLYDMSQLGGLYRAGSFLGLAICLSAVALLLQRFVLRKEEEG